MKLDYPKILNNNLLNVLKDVLKNIQKNGLEEGHHLFITFNTQNKKINIPNWLLKKFPKEMTIIIQYEYWNLKVLKNYFHITLSFEDIKTELIIPFNSIISFVDPYANFGLKIIQNSKKDKNKVKKDILNNDNVIELKNFKNKI